WRCPMMQNQSQISRRNFIASAALGTAVGISLPSLLGSVAAARPARYDETQAEPLLLHRNESPYGLAPAAAKAAHSILTGQANRSLVEEQKALKGPMQNGLGVNRRWVARGWGSIKILKMAPEIFCSPPRPAFVAEPPFEAVSPYSPLMPSHAEKVPLTA